ncbi:hypothetical protein ACFPFV_09200 [Salinicoccus siamensis]
MKAASSTARNIWNKNYLDAKRPGSFLFFGFLSRFFYRSVITWFFNWFF